MKVEEKRNGKGGREGGREGKKGRSLHRDARNAPTTKVLPSLRGRSRFFFYIYSFPADATREKKGNDDPIGREGEREVTHVYVRLLWH